MPKVQKRTFSLTQDQSAYVDAKVAAGGYASSSEVVREGLRAMQQRDAEIDRWVTEQVVPTYHRWKDGLEPEYSPEQVAQFLETKRLARKKAS